MSEERQGFSSKDLRDLVGIISPTAAYKLAATERMIENIGGATDGMGQSAGLIRNIMGVKALLEATDLDKKGIGGRISSVLTFVGLGEGIIQKATGHGVQDFIENPEVRQDLLQTVREQGEKGKATATKSLGLLNEFVAKQLGGEDFASRISTVLKGDFKEKAREAVQNLTGVELGGNANQFVASVQAKLSEIKR